MLTTSTICTSSCTLSHEYPREWHTPRSRVQDPLSALGKACSWICSWPWSCSYAPHSVQCRVQSAGCRVQCDAGCCVTAVVEVIGDMYEDAADRHTVISQCYLLDKYPHIRSTEYVLRTLYWEQKWQICTSLLSKSVQSNREKGDH